VLALIAPAIVAPAVFGQSAEPQFVDWAAYDSGFTAVTGSLFGAAVRIETSAPGAFHPAGPLDGSSTLFSGPAFSPPLARADAPELFGTDPAAPYTITFGAPVRDPIIHFESLASTVTFSAPVAKRSGDPEFVVSGNTVSSPPDHNGSVQLSGDFTSIPFTVLWTGSSQPDGIDFAVGGTPVPPVVTEPPTPVPPTPTPTIVIEPPVLLPVAGVTVVSRPESGSVRVRVPGAAAFAPLEGAQTIPVGATVDARKGAVTVVSDAGGSTASARVAAGIFTIRQARAAGSIPSLVVATAAGQARACAPGRPRPRSRSGVVRKLSGATQGTFRVVPKKGIVTGRNATWTTADRCDGTLTTVRRGRVTVRRGHRSIRVSAGHRYRIAARLFAARRART
jgi:hypothetical protein